MLRLFWKQQVGLAEIYRGFETFLLGGVRSGKTTVSVEAAIQAAFEWEPGETGILAAPTWGQLERNLLSAWRELAPRGRYDIILDSKNPRIECYLGNGKISKVILASGRNPETLEGATAGWGCGTELQQMEGFWGQVRRRVSSKSAKQIRLWGDGLTVEGWLTAEVKVPGIGVVFFSTYDNLHNLAANYLANLSKRLTPRQWAIYVLGKWAGVEDAIFPTFSRAIHATDPVLFQPGRRVLVGQDFNLNPMTSVFAHWEGAELFLFDELIQPNTTQEHAAAIVQWAKDRGIDHTDERQFIVIPDASGAYRQQSGLTNFYLFKQAGLRLGLFGKNPLRGDGDQAVLVLLENAAKEHRLHIDPDRCSRTVSALANFRYSDRAKKDHPLSHPVDAVRYLAHFLAPIKAPRGLRPPPDKNKKRADPGSVNRFERDASRGHNFNL